MRKKVVGMCSVISRAIRTACVETLSCVFCKKIWYIDCERLSLINVCSWPLDRVSNISVMVQMKIIKIETFSHLDLKETLVEKHATMSITFLNSKTLLGPWITSHTSNFWGFQIDPTCYHYGLVITILSQYPTTSNHTSSMSMTIQYDTSLCSVRYLQDLCNLQQSTPYSDTGIENEQQREGKLSSLSPSDSCPHTHEVWG